MLFDSKKTASGYVRHSIKVVDGYTCVSIPAVSTILFILNILLYLSIVVGLFAFIEPIWGLPQFKTIAFGGLFLMFIIAVVGWLFLLSDHYNKFKNPKLLETCFYNVEKPYRDAIIVYVRDYLNKGLYFRYWDGIKLLDISDMSVRPLTSNESTLFSVLEQYGEKYPQAVSYWDYQDACGGAFTTGWPTALVFSFILPIHLLTGSEK